jgi:stress response protein YsnF
VNTGGSGPTAALVPLHAAALPGGQLQVPYDRELLWSAPHHDPGRELTPQDEVDLYAHYGLRHGDPSPTDVPGPQGPREAVGRRDVVDPAVDPAGDPAAGPAMTRSEEQLRVRVESQPVERVRLRKYVVTDYEQVTVEVRREELRLEHLPPGPDDLAVTGSGSSGVSGDVAPEDAYRGPDDAGVPGPTGAGTADEHVIILHEERPVIRMETVPVERVRLRKETVTDHETVSGEVRREEIEVDTDPDGR